MRFFLLPVWRMLHGAVNMLQRLSVTERIRFAVIALLGLAIVAMVYAGTLRFLRFLDSQILFGYLTPAVSLSLILSVVSLFVFFSALSLMIGSLTQAADADFLYALPLAPMQLVLIRLCETAFNAGWMSLVLSLPLLAAVGAHAGAAFFSFMPAGVLILILFFTAVAALGVSGAILLVRIFPPALVSRYLGMAILIVALGTIILFFFTRADSNPVVDMVHLVSSAFLPSSWVATTLGELVLNAPLSSEAYLAGGAFLILALSSAVFLSELSLKRAASRALERSGRSVQRTLLARLTAWLPDPARGIFLRELAFIVRTPSTLVHLLFLSVLALGYGGLLSRFELGAAPAVGDPRSWQMAYLGMNMSIAGFIATAFLSRLALPMTSMEGRAVWLSLSAPARIMDSLKLRRVFWSLPGCGLTCAIGSIGTFYISADPYVRATAVILSLLLGWCLVTVALACGARFARFNWNHPGELIASFGSMVFMILSVLITTVLGIAFCAAVVLRNLQTSLVLISLCSGAIVVGEIILRRSESAMLRRCRLVQRLA